MFFVWEPIYLGSEQFSAQAVFWNPSGSRWESLGSALGCAMRVKDGAVPNEHGTWLYGRGGWCDGLQVNPWRMDITKQVSPLITLSLFITLTFD